MTLAIDRNDPAIRAHAETYRQAAAAKRRQALIGILVFIACVLLSARGAEVDLAKFFENIHRFPKYIYETLPTLRLASLGADLGEWYWGLKGWLKLLWQTILIAYVGTILGAAGAFLFCFAAAANLGRAPWLRFAVRRFLEFWQRELEGPLRSVACSPSPSTPWARSASSSPRWSRIST